MKYLTLLIITCSRRKKSLLKMNQAEKARFILSRFFYTLNKKLNVQEEAA
jgi:hypothetical protein